MPEDIPQGMSILILFPFSHCLCFAARMPIISTSMTIWLSHQKLSFCKLHLISIPIWRYLEWDSLEKPLQSVVRTYADPHLQILRETAASPSELTYRLNHSETQAQKEVWEEQSQRWWPMSQLTRRSHFSKKILLSIPETTLSWPLLSK